MMGFFITLLLLAFSSSPSYALTCYEQGRCQNASIVATHYATDYNMCRDWCQREDDCTFFTVYLDNVRFPQCNCSTNSF